MDTAHPAGGPAAPAIERLLARRRRYRQISCAAGALLLASVLLARGGRNGTADDWAAFDRRRATVTSVAADGTVLVRTPEGAEATVRPLGVDYPQNPVAADGGGAASAVQASRYLASRVLGEEVTLRLEQPQTRSPDGALLAYLFLSDTDDLNLDLVHDGQAFADRRSPHSFKAQFEQAEADARKKGRGMWKDLADEQMPAWRQQWVGEMREKAERVGKKGR